MTSGIEAGLSPEAQQQLNAYGELIATKLFPQYLALMLGLNWHDITSTRDLTVYDAVDFANLVTDWECFVPGLTAQLVGVKTQFPKDPDTIIVAQFDQAARTVDMKEIDNEGNTHRFLSIKPIASSPVLPPQNYLMQFTLRQRNKPPITLNAITPNTIPEWRQ
jgi:hypothetical protein